MLYIYVKELERSIPELNACNQNVIKSLALRSSKFIFARQSSRKARITCSIAPWTGFNAQSAGVPGPQKPWTYLTVSFVVLRELCEVIQTSLLEVNCTEMTFMLVFIGILTT